MAVPSPVWDVKIVSPISTFVLNTLILKKVRFFFLFGELGERVQNGGWGRGEKKGIFASPPLRVLLSIASVDSDKMLYLAFNLDSHFSEVGFKGAVSGFTMILRGSKTHLDFT